MIRKNVVTWIGIILCALVAAIVLAIPAVSNLFAIIPAALFIPLVITLAKADSKVVEEEESLPAKEIDWPLVIAWSLVALTAVATLLVLIFFGWWFLLPLAILSGLFIWVAHLLDWHTFWTVVFIVLIIIAVVLLGVYAIVGDNGGVNNHLDNLYVDNLYVEEATVATMDVEDMTVENETVANQDVENQSVTNQDVENSEVTNQTVTNQVVEDQTVENQVVENTEPPATEPPATQPPATQPPATEPPATEPPHTHSYTSVVTEPTCMEQGYTTHTCSCGHSYKDSYTGALGHSYKSTVVAPTTEAGGYTEHKCERCGHTYKSDFTDPLPQETEPAPTEPEVTPKISCAKTIRFGETLYINLEGIDASNLKVSNKAFVSVEIISNSRVAITLTEDVTGYITVTDKVSGTNVVIDIVE